MDALLDELEKEEGLEIGLCFPIYDEERMKPASSLYILPFSHSYSVFRSFSKQQDCLMLGFFDISCQKPQAGAICAYSKQNVVP